MGECVARELKEAKLKPLEAGSPLRIGLLASNATLAAGFYQEKLQNEVISFWGSFSLMYQIILP
jgi:aspartate/glutamate racemase